MKNTAYVPNSSPSLISVPALDKAKCYSVFGAGKCVVFSQDDEGKFIKELIDKTGIVFTAMKDDSRLYSLDQDTPDTAITGDVESFIRRVNWVTSRSSQMLSFPYVMPWIICYLKGTSDYELVLGGLPKGNPSFDPFFVHSNANFADNPDEHGHSISGGALFFNTGCFHWYAQKQTQVAIGTPGAEYYAGSICGAEIV
ncbi:hypothetical protein C8R42DRAFT_726898 [Lentinula raphanica]|nr:hypothetical protein C8R42DRAFT_726898 [Lentinula raphanica]